jgi:NADH-quinone oxidoreductase subunit K
MEIAIGHYLTVGAILFTVGVFGIFLNRKNVIIILMSVELILLAVNFRNRGTIEVEDINLMKG